MNDDKKSPDVIEELKKGIASSGSVEREYVQRTYDLIAPHFSSTRYKPWPLVEKFILGMERGSLVADVGCGNGKYLGLNKTCYCIGSDMYTNIFYDITLIRSVNLIDICKQRGFESLVADGLKLPYKSNSFDYVICIAVIHHFSSPERRLEALRELYKVARHGAKILVTAWALEQEKKKYEEQDVLVPWHLQASYEKPKEKKKKPSKRKQKGARQQPEPSTNVNSNETNLNQNEDSSSQTINNNENNTNTDPNVNNNNFPTTTENPNLGEKKLKDNQEFTVYQRYYHLFKKGEMEELASHIPGATVLESEWDHDNWYVVILKQ